jgi:hypothetical protein
MSLETNTKYFDVFGCGYVSEHHADERRRHLMGSEKNAVGGAMAWLAFYAIALVVVVIANFQKAGDIVVTAAN